MERSEQINNIGISLMNCVTAKGVKITDVFTNDEIRDFANTIIALVPQGLQTDIDEVVEDVLFFADKEEFILKRLKALISPIMLSFIQTSDIDKPTEPSQEELEHLLFTIILTLNVIFNKDIDEVMSEMINYYKSLLITKDSLDDNITVVSVPGETVANAFFTHCVRLNIKHNDYIPTIKTITNFKQLIPKEYGKFIQPTDTDNE